MLYEIAFTGSSRTRRFLFVVGPWVLFFVCYYICAWLLRALWGVAFSRLFLGLALHRYATNASSNGENVRAVT
jgi:hypothetical protein